MPFAKFAHDFVLRLWFKKIAKNQIKYHCTRGALLFTNIKYAQNTLRKFSKYFTYRKFTMAQAIQNDISKFFAYLLTKLFKIQWMNQHGFISSSCYMSVCVILKKVFQVNERILLILNRFWQAIGFFFKRSLFASHMFLVPTTHWMILRPFVFIDVSLWVKPKNSIVLLKLFGPSCQLFPQRTPLQLYVNCTLFH